MDEQVFVYPFLLQSVSLWTLLVSLLFRSVKQSLSLLSLIVLTFLFSLFSFLSLSLFPSVFFFARFLSFFSSVRSSALLSLSVWLLPRIHASRSTDQSLNPLVPWLKSIKQSTLSATRQTGRSIRNAESIGRVWQEGEKREERKEEPGGKAEKSIARDAPVHVRACPSAWLHHHYPGQCVAENCVKFEPDILQLKETNRQRDHRVIDWWLLPALGGLLKKNFGKKLEEREMMQN